MKHRILNIVALVHAIVMVVAAIQYRLYQSHQTTENKLMAHVQHLSEQIKTAQSRLAEYKSPENVMRYAMHTLGMQQLHPSQVKTASEQL